MYILYIKKYRQLRRITQEELALISGISPSYISTLESPTRKKSPTLAILRDISIALKVCIKDIIYCDCNNCHIKNTCSKKDNINYKDVAEKNFDFYI